MPRKSRKKADPTPIGEVLETLPVAPLIQQATEDAAVESFKQQREREQAITDPAQSDDLAAHLEARRRKAEIEPERPMPEPEPVGEHTAAVLARRPKMQPTPAEFMGVASFPPAGVRVSKSFDKRVAAIQFSGDKPLSRATEYDLMTQIQDAGFQYQPQRKQWERTAPDRMALGENVIDATRIAKEIADARNVERGR